MMRESVKGGLEEGGGESCNVATRDLGALFECSGCDLVPGNQELKSEIGFLGLPLHSATKLVFHVWAVHLCLQYAITVHGRIWS